MRIVYFLDNFAPQLNGVVISEMNTIKAMASFGYEIMIVIPSPSIRFFKREKITREKFIRKYENVLGNVKIFCIPSIWFPLYPGFRITAIRSRKIFQAVKKFKPDIIHFYSQLTLGLLSVHLSKNLGCRLFGSFHTFFADPEYIRNNLFLRITGLYKSRLLQALLWWYNNHYFYSNCNKVITVSEYSRNVLISRGISPETINVVPNGISIDEYEHGSIIDNSCDNKRYLLFVGRISIEKSLDILIKAMNIVFSNIDDIHLVLVGDGPYRRELKRLIKTLKLENRIVHLGFVSNDSLMRSNIYKNAEIFVTASKSELLPVSVLESMSSSLPVVGVDKGGVPELLQFGNGIVVAPDNYEEFANAVLQLLNDKSLHASMKKNAFRAAGLFNEKKINLDMHRVYQNELI